MALFTGFQKSYLWIYPQGQEPFLACIIVFKPPVFATGREDEQKHAVTVGQFIRFGLGLGVANLRI
jgi:hypothetical protein